jgi:spore germination protein KA
MNGAQNITDKDELLLKEITSENIKNLFKESSDVVNRDILIFNKSELKVTLFYVDGMTNMKVINDDIVYPLSTSKWYENCRTMQQAYTLSLNGAIETSTIKPAQSAKEAVQSILFGMSIVVFDALKSALIVNTIGFEKRSVSPATEENTYRSGKDSFVETLRMNTAALRKKIKSHNLVLEENMVGKQTNTRYCLAYMHNICNEEFVNTVKSRIAAINQDKVMTIQDIYSNIVKEKYTPFPTAIITEKPDVCCQGLLEGRIAIIIDELPYSLILPAIFGDFFQASSDYSDNFILTSFFRIIRYICFFLSIIFPGFFVAVTTFHGAMIPYSLAIKIAASRAGVPFSMFIEVLLMSFAFYILVQASLQISRAIGATISIVGGLVLGQAAITAGIVSPATIVVVATAAISSMAIPNKEVNSVIWLFQLICTVLSSVFGLIGTAITLLLIFFMLARLKPLGVPYLSPFTSLKPLQLQDSIIKFPQNLIKNRPLFLDPKNRKRKG